MSDPNTRKYVLRWRDSGAPYVHPSSHQMEFALDEAMRIAGFTDVDVIDPESGQVLWHGSTATRSARL